MGAELDLDDVIAGHPLAEAEVRRLRREATDVFECADGTVAKDATVAAQSWADECRRLREREAKARELMESATVIMDSANVGGWICDDMLGWIRSE